MLLQLGVIESSESAKLTVELIETLTRLPIPKGAIQHAVVGLLKPRLECLQALLPLDFSQVWGQAAQAFLILLYRRGIGTVECLHLLRCQLQLLLNARSTEPRIAHWLIDCLVIRPIGLAKILIARGELPV